MAGLLVALASFLAPGLTAAVLTRSRAPLETTLLGGYVALHSVILALQLTGCPLTPGAALAGLLLVAAGLAAAARVRGAVVWPRAWVPRGPRWGWAPVGVVFVALAARSWSQALHGLDVPFRWGFLAEQMLQIRSLDFYPPLSDADFVVYGFPDGMSPLVSGAYWYVWAWSGATDPRLAAPLVALQWLCLCTLAWRLAARLAGPAAGAWAGALAASCAFLVEVVGHGQEVGLTTLALLAGLHAIVPAREGREAGEAGGAGDEDRAGAALEAGLALSAGALAREYGVALTLPVLAAARTGGFAGRHLLVVLLTVGALAGPWYARNLVRTGNPLYDLPVEPWFPARTIYPALMRLGAAELGWSSQPLTKAHLALASLLERAPLLLLLGLPGLLRRQARPLVLGAVLVGALWLHSVKFTGGGLLYSTRVLAPTMALLAVAGGLLAATRGVAIRRGLGALLAASTAWTVATALAAPSSPTRLAPGDWLGQVTNGQGRARPADWVWRGVVPGVLPPGARILSGSPYLGPALQGTGYEVVTIWSPEVAFLFTEGPTYAEAQPRLAALGIVAFHDWSAPERRPEVLQRVRFFVEASPLLRPLADAPTSGHRLVVFQPPDVGQEGARRGPPR